MIQRSNNIGDNTISMCKQGPTLSLQVTTGTLLLPLVKKINLPVG